MKTETKFTVGEYKTRDRRRARVYATDGGGTYTIQGAIFDDKDCLWFMNKWNNAGRWFAGKESDNDLMPPLREWWIYKDNIFDTIEGAERFRDSALSGTNTRIIHVREVRDDQA